jgi:ribosomal protein L29
MKHQKQFAELKGKSRVELEKIVLELRAKVWQYRIDLASGKTNSGKEISGTKKAIARAMTLISAMPASNK